MYSGFQTNHVPSDKIHVLQYVRYGFSLMNNKYLGNELSIVVRITNYSGAVFRMDERDR
jgi:hypothetical protein